MTFDAFGPKKPILETEEFRRILALPRVRTTDAEAKQLADDMTRALRRSEGTMKLRPIQARALAAIGQYGGLFGPMRVGAGKTLTSLLAPYILESKRPVLILPAHLAAKTRDDMRELQRHWLIPSTMGIVSYQMLGRESAARMLSDVYKNPDLLVFDEAHYLKNRKAAVTRRVSRYMKEHPETKVVAISGTIMKDSLKDFGHIIEWALKGGSPLPRERGELEEWADAIDEKLQNEFKRLAPGPLLRFCTPEDLEADTKTQAARRGLRRRMIETPGVVATQNEQVDCNLHISCIEYDVNATTDENFAKLRGEWKTPDDWELMLATERWRVANELALGFHYVQVDKDKYTDWQAKKRTTGETLDAFLARSRPPQEWRNARSAWAKYVRDVLKRSHTLDSELQVRLSVMKGERPDGTEILNAWKAIEPTCALQTFAVWHDESALNACLAWMESNVGIVWCSHTFFAEELSRRSKRPYYGAQGLNSRGEAIEKALPENGTIIASIPANGTGRNLQKFARNLIVQWPSCPARNEQLLGRTHRDGQEAKAVTVHTLMGCIEHYNAWVSSLSGAQAHLDTTGLSQKLLVASTSGFPDESCAERDEPRWGNGYEAIEVVL